MKNFARVMGQLFGSAGAHTYPKKGASCPPPTSEWLVWRLCEDSVESDAFYGGFMVKLLWRLSGNMIQHVFCMN